MAGAGLIAIKSRIKTVTSTQKITRAMGLVATSKLRKTRDKLGANDKYSSYFGEIYSELINNFPKNSESIYTHGNGCSKKLYIVLTSDSGLCGGFNSAVVSRAVKELDNDKEDSSYILVGEKGRSYFSRYKKESVAEYVDIPDLPTSKEAHMLTNHALKMYDNKEVGEVNIVFTKFVSTIKQEVAVKKLLPLGYNKNDELKPYIKLEPSVEEFVSQTITLFLSQAIQNCMLNAKASEQGSRMAAMDGATKNATEILENLHLKYNRIRQGAITQEISEIVGGAEAQK